LAAVLNDGEYLGDVGWKIVGEKIERGGNHVDG
jgi:hypothetical protein